MLARRNRARRAKALEPCLGLFDAVATGIAPDGYPSLRGIVDGRRVTLSLIPDTLTVKRLPQLWLSIVMPCDAAAAPLALTARPRGEDYVSLRSHAGGALAVPPWLPGDFSVHGAATAAALLERLRGCGPAIFADPAVKEIAIVAGKIHLLYRLSEGRRGAHLLFREAVFDDALTPERLRALLDALTAVERAARRSDAEIDAAVDDA